MVNQITFPLFELYGPPCLTEGCKGVGTWTATKASGFKDWRYRCSECSGDCAYSAPKEFSYRITTNWDDQEGAFIARMSAFPGLSVDGPTEEDAIREACVVARGMLEDLVERGQPLPPSDLTGDPE
jgi:predicted RNase H-like HicB family nuclease